MLKLVTQFDNKESKVSLATPTCGCSSCCCCCCIVSVIMVPAITARSFAGAWAKDEAETTNFYPEGIPKDDTHLEKVKKDKVAIGFFVLLVILSAAAIGAIVVIIDSYSFNTVIGSLLVMAVAFVLYVLIFLRLRERGYSVKRIVVRNIIALLILAASIAAELFAGVFLFLLIEAPVIYLLLVIAAIASVIVLMVRK